MQNDVRDLKKLVGFIITLLPLLIIPPIVFGMEVNNKLERHREYLLKINGDRISLKAKDASLKNILEEIGRRMKIDIVANIPPEEKISIELENMYLEDVLKRLKTDYAYVAKTKTEKGMITKIILVPKGGGKAQPDKFSYNPQPPIQKFKYNPQPPIEKSMIEPKPAEAKSENESSSLPAEKEHNPQTSESGSKNNSQTPDIGSEGRF